MNKTELITAVAIDTGLKKKDVEAVLAAMEGVIVSTVARGETVQLPNFLKFERRHKPARLHYNPASKTTEMSEAKNAAKVTTLTGFNRVVNGG